MGAERYAGLLTVLLVVAVHANYNSTDGHPFFYDDWRQGVPQHVTSTPVPPTFTTTPLGSSTLTPVAAGSFTTTPVGDSSSTMTPSGGLSQAAKVGIGVVGGTAAAAGLALGGFFIHDSVKKSNAEKAALALLSATTTAAPFGTANGTIINFKAKEEAQETKDNSTSSSSGSSGDVLMERSSGSWVFWLLIASLACCALAAIGACIYLMKKKKKTRKFAGKAPPPAAASSVYPAAPSTDTMPLIAPPGPLMDSRVKLQPYTYAQPEAPVYTTSTAATVYTPAPATSGGIFGSLAPATPMPVGTAFAAPQPTADFGTTVITTAPAPATSGGFFGSMAPAKPMPIAGLANLGVVTGGGITTLQPEQYAREVAAPTYTYASAAPTVSPAAFPNPALNINRLVQLPQ